MHMHTHRDAGVLRTWFMEVPLVQCGALRRSIGGGVEYSKTWVHDDSRRTTAGPMLGNLLQPGRYSTNKGGGSLLHEPRGGVGGGALLHEQRRGVWGAFYSTNKTGRGGGLSIARTRRQKKTRPVTALKPEELSQCWERDEKHRGGWDGVGQYRSRSSAGVLMRSHSVAMCCPAGFRVQFWGLRV